MITIRELLSNQCSFDDLDENIQSNITELHARINKVREAWGNPMVVTSGFRSMEHHLEIYRKKGITNKNDIPMRSNHLSGKAVDISDVNCKLQKWCLENEFTLAKIGLWMEDFKYTQTWVHFQICPPKSGNRFFIP
jgi:uncharacterized protein YcbK (DUF882 family)